MIITISGTPASGKSSVAKKLAAALNWPRYYMGGIRREKAKELGLTLEEYNQLGESDPKTDYDVDEYMKHLGETEDNFIIEGRTAWYFIPNSLKLYFEIDEKRAAHLINRDLQSGFGADRNENNIRNEEEALVSIRKRMASDKLRYRKYYNIDVNDKNNYDYTIDTTNMTIDEAFAQVYAFIREKLKNSE
jgi:cytidylate kinase